MTILRGEKTIVDGFTQFEDRLNVTKEEKAQALSDDQQEEALEWANTYRLKDGRQTTDDIIEVDEEIINESLLSGGLTAGIIEVLENRDRPYVHLYDGHVHTIVEIFQEE